MINKALLMGASGKGNYGDELLAWTTVNLLKSVNPDIEGIVLSYNPIISGDFFLHEHFEYASYYHYFPSLKYPRSFLFFRSIKKFKEYDVAIFPGGGFLYDYSLSALLSWYRRFLALNKIKVPIVLLGVGIGPLRTSMSRFLAGKILNLCKLVIVRDKMSYDVSKAVSPHSPGIQLGADLNIFFSRFAEFAVEKKSKSKRCVVMPRVWPYQYTRKYVDSTVQSFAKLISIARDYFSLDSVEFVPMHRFDDAALCQKISSKIFVNNAVYKIRNFKDLLSPLSMTNMVIAMRYHGLLLSLLAHKPMVAIAYDEKITSLMNEFNRKENTISWDDFNNLNEEAIIKCFETVRKDKLKDVPDLIAEKQNRMMAHVKELF
ncbi:MAG: hypothetical protein A2Y62_15290 [Candidatus Fischerbacteria bacterium RBG_13_37_8]|uniref:Polysaccharide pyruvyl transferase domain-containing protein n=1 Tax=Candidatus Fischerbacteria bacterium RBG_13_37_8 TaxID=1817863 RepID=A0A1F5VKT4_9BACT|nr:MAG: hypothetical protein A2Y62_15290 [Candidatus Fischerbacteria bacterium RBG_13_37_8]